MDNIGSPCHCSPYSQAEAALPVPRAATFSRSHSLISGFTLLELVVTLAVMGIALAVIGPALVRRRTDSAELFANLVSDSRRTATRRAEAVQLDLNPDGSWILFHNLSGDPSAIERGSISESPGRVTVRISPLGICGSDSSGPVPIDPLTCSVTRIKR